MSQYIIISPCYELLRYGHDRIKNHVADAHALGKKTKFVIGKQDLIDPSEPLEKYSTDDWKNIGSGLLPSPFKFEFCQFESADIVIFVRDGKSTILKSNE